SAWREYGVAGEGMEEPSRRGRHDARKQSPPRPTDSLKMSQMGFGWGGLNVRVGLVTVARRPIGRREGTAQFADLVALTIIRSDVVAAIFRARIITVTI